MTAITSYKCEVCGYVHEGSAPPETCPVCGVGAEMFTPLEVAPAGGVARRDEGAAPTAWRCTVCGHVHRGARPPERCPVCHVDASLFEPHEETSGAGGGGGGGGRIVVIGAGVAGLTAASRARRADPSATITLVSREPGLPYYRLNLTRYLAGEVGEEDLVMQPRSWFEQRDVALTHGEVTAVDRDARRVRLRDGGSLPYDALVLACGSHAFIPPIAGATRDGVLPLRTLRDARAIMERAGDGARAAVIGGGLLGLEAAGALLRRGAAVTVIEGHGWLLPRQLAEPAGAMLLEDLRGQGLDIRSGAQVEAIVGDEAVRAVRLAGGTEVPADVVVMATGVRPNSYLARQAGLEVDHGVLIDDRTATSDPAIYACGDVAEHRGVCYGIWPASYAQGVAAGINAAGGEASFGGLPPSNTIKVLDVDLYSIGRFAPDDGSYLVIEERADRRYLRLVCRDGRLVGANLYGDTALANPVREAIESGTPIAQLAELLDRVPALRGSCSAAG